MILRRYGKRYLRVEPVFNARALTEIAFRGDREHAMDVEEFERLYRRTATHRLSPRATGDVQDETETQLLTRLLEELREIAGSLGPDELLVVENGPGPDYPKTRQRASSVVAGYENRIRFEYFLAPPLRLATYTRKDPQTKDPQTGAGNDPQTERAS